MNTAIRGRDPFLPRSPKGRGAALALALLAHTLLLGALAYGVHWRNTVPTPQAAELWSAVPQAAAPRLIEPAPVPVPTPQPAPQPTPMQPPPPRPAALPARPAPPPLPDPQIAIEQAKKRAAVKREQADADAREAAERTAAEAKRAQDKARARDAEKAAEIEKAEKAAKAAKTEEATKRKAELVKAERDKATQVQAQAKSAQAAQEAKAEEARTAAARTANLKRMQGLAGATGGASDTGSALHSGAPSPSYAGRIMASIKPNIVFSDAIDGNPLATVEVKLAPDGTIVSKRLVKSSGVRAWDEAVLRAIERTEKLPRDIDGRVPAPFQIDFKYRD